MATFTRTWDGAYEAIPADSEDISLGASRIRQTREDIGERLVIDHSWAGDGDDGKHKVIQLLVQSDPTLDALDGGLYAKGAPAELYYKDSSGNVVQLTNLGSDIWSPGDGKICFYDPSSPPTGWLEPNGAAVSRTTFDALFAAIGVTYGVGDGSTTFNLPNLDERVLAHVTGAGDYTLGNTFGSDTHVLDTTEQNSQDNHAAGVTGAPSATIANSLAAGSVAATGAHTHATPELTHTLSADAAAHENRQQTIVVGFLIKT